MTLRNAEAFEVSGGKHPDASKPGAFYFLLAPDGLAVEKGTKIGMVHACPCGCGGRTALWFKTPAREKGTPMWDVTGEWPKVTLSPSIGILYDAAGNRSTYHWHGWLRNGVFVEG